MSRDGGRTVPWETIGTVVAWLIFLSPLIGAIVWAALGQHSWFQDPNS